MFSFLINLLNSFILIIKIVVSDSYSILEILPQPMQVSKCGLLSIKIFGLA